MHTNENVAIGLFQRDYAKNPFWNRRKRSGSKTWRTTGRNGALCTSHKGTTWKRAQKNISNKYKNNQKSSLKMPILRLKGDYGHFKLLKYTEGRFNHIHPCLYFNTMKGTCEQIPFHFFLKFMMLS